MHAAPSIDFTLLVVFYLTVCTHMTTIGEAFFFANPWVNSKMVIEKWDDVREKLWVPEKWGEIRGKLEGTWGKLEGTRGKVGELRGKFGDKEKSFYGRERLHEYFGTTIPHSRRRRENTDFSSRLKLTEEKIAEIVKAYVYPSLSLSSLQPSLSLFSSRRWRRLQAAPRPSTAVNLEEETRIAELLEGPLDQLTRMTKSATKGLPQEHGEEVDARGKERKKQIWLRYVEKRKPESSQYIMATDLPLSYHSALRIKAKWLHVLPAVLASCIRPPSGNESKPSGKTKGKRGKASEIADLPIPDYCTTGNTCEIYDEGGACLSAMMRAIDSAQKRVWMETYCLDESAVGRAVIAKLSQAARRGVDVILCCDGIGSFGLSNTLRSELKSSGGKFVLFNPVWRRIGPTAYRNHRKVLIADHIGFCGSMNADWRSGASEVANRVLEEAHAHIDAAAERKISLRNRLQKKFSLNSLVLFLFRDQSKSRPADYNQHVRVEGPCVDALAHSFTHHLELNGLPLKRNWKLNLPVSSFLPRKIYGAPTSSTNCLVQVVESDGKKGLNESSYGRCLRKLTENAIHSIVIASSYFHPPPSLRFPLGATLRRGVPGTLILSGLSDVPFDTQATLAILPYFLVGSKNYCRAFFIKHRHVHAKTVTVDNVLSLVGSSNWDRYSFRRNREAGLLVVDPAFTNKVNQLLQAQLSQEAKLRKNVYEYKIADARKMDLLSRVASIASYHLIRLTGSSFWDGFTTTKKIATTAKNTSDPATRT